MIHLPGNHPVRWVMCSKSTHFVPKAQYVDPGPSIQNSSITYGVSVFAIISNGQKVNKKLLTKTFANFR